VVGAGPTGLTLANLLGQQQIPAILIERNLSTVTEPRAVSIDDESLRTMQAIGLHEQVLQNVVRGYGVHYFTKPGGRCFGKVQPSTAEYGFPRRNAFRQPLLEATLREGLARFASVRVLFGHTLESLTQDAQQVTAMVGRAGADALEIRASYVVGCDGARSLVRKICGVALRGSSFESRWLVVDTEHDDDTFWHTRVYCDPARPVVNLPGPHRTRRFEFLLRPDERDDEMLRAERIRELVGPFQHGRPIHIARKTVYTFHARIAQRWRIGRIFLAGDAAHLTPPYAGQGMNSGIRDAHNLGWKLAAAVQGRMGEGALDSYEAERRDHAWSLIRLAMNLGIVMAPRTRIRASAIACFFTVAGLIPGLREYFLQMKFKPKPRYKRGLIVPARGGAERAIVGRMLPQPVVRTADAGEQPLDWLVGPGFALIAYGTEDTGVLGRLSHPLWHQLDATRIAIVSPRAVDSPPLTRAERYRCVADGTNLLAPIFAGLGDKLLLLRPDRYVAGVFSVDEEPRFAQCYRETLRLDAASGELAGPPDIAEPTLE